MYRIDVILTPEEMEWLCSTLHDKIFDAKFNAAFAPGVEREWWKKHSVWIEPIYNKIVKKY